MLAPRRPSTSSSRRATSCARVSLAVGAREVVCLVGPQRRGQDHDPAHHHGLPPAARRAHRVPRARPSRAAAPTRSPGSGSASRPRTAAIFARSHGGREHRDRHLDAARRRGPPPSASSAPTSVFPVLRGYAARKGPQMSGGERKMLVDRPRPGPRSRTAAARRALRGALARHHPRRRARASRRSPSSGAPSSSPSRTSTTCREYATRLYVIERGEIIFAGRPRRGRTPTRRCSRVDRRNSLMADLPLIPSTVVGSHGKPGWWFASVKALRGRRVRPRRPGGDVRRRRRHGHPRHGARGHRHHHRRRGPPARRLRRLLLRHHQGHRAPARAPQGRARGATTSRRATRRSAASRRRRAGSASSRSSSTSRPTPTRRTKATCAGPLTFGSRIHPGKMYKGVVDVAERFAEVINEELEGLVAAGADFIQLDEPARGNVSGEEMARLFNLATEGVKAKLAFHVCFGNRFGRSRFDRTYRPYFPGAAQGARRPVRPGVRGPRALRARPLEGVRRGSRARRGRHRREGLLPGDRRGRGRAHPRACSRCARPRSST